MPINDPSVIEQLEAQMGGAVDPAAAAEIERQLAAERAYVPIPSVVPEPTGQGFGSRVGRPSATMTGAMLGAQVGLGAGPLGAATGGILGAGLGSLGYDTATDIGARTGMLSPKFPRLSPEERVLQAGKEMSYEAGGQGVAQAIGAPIGRAIGNKLTGIRTAGPGQAARIGSEAQLEAMRAQKHGIDVGLVDVSPKQWVKFWPKVIGRFPFVGTPFKEATARKAVQAGKGLDRITVRLGPSATIAQQGIDLNRAAKASFKSFRTEAGKLYTEARRVGDEAGSVIPTKPIKEAIGDINRAAQERWRVKLAEDPSSLIPTKPVQADDVGKFLDEAANIEDTLSASQLDTFLTDLDDLMARSKREGWSISRLMQVKKASEAALRSPEVAEAAPALAKAVQEADGFFAKGMTTFETPTAQKFGRVTKDLFKVGLKKPGGFNEDELFTLAWNDKSAKAMRDLRAIVGPDVFKKSLHTRLKVIYDASSAQSGYLGRLNADLPDGAKIIDPDVFMKRLGLSIPGSAEADALREALVGTGISRGQLKEFASVIKTAFAAEVPDVSTFITRRAALGGARSMIRGLAGPGGAVMAGSGLLGTNGPLTAAGITLLTRHVGKILADPKKLRLFTTSLRQTVPFVQRRAAMLRLLTKMAELEETEVSQLQQGL